MAKYTFDPTAKAFRASNGRFVSEVTLRAALDDIERAARDQLATLTAEMQRGELTVNAWYEAMREAIESANLTAGALAAGGFDSVDDAISQTIRDYINSQLSYLKVFRDTLVSQTAEELQSPRNLARAMMYSGNTRTVYHDIRRAGLIEQNYDECRNILGHVATDHCIECPDLTDEGYVPIDEMPLPGERTCMTNCACHLEYRRSPAMMASLDQATA